MAQMPSPLTLPDLGVTITAKPDGTAELDLGWFGQRAISTADIAALQLWIEQVVAATQMKE
jgi:hypothetical protein